MAAEDLENRTADMFTAFGPKDDKTLIYTQDFATVVRRLGASPSEADIAELMKKSGKDQSSTISREEFASITEGMSFDPASAFDALHDQLATFQAGDGGALDLPKLKAALMTTGERMTEEEVQRAPPSLMKAPSQDLPIRQRDRHRPRVPVNRRHHEADQGEDLIDTLSPWFLGLLHGLVEAWF